MLFGLYAGMLERRSVLSWALLIGNARRSRFASECSRTIGRNLGVRGFAFSTSGRNQPHLTSPRTSCDEHPNCRAASASCYGVTKIIFEFLGLRLPDPRPGSVSVERRPTSATKVGLELARGRGIPASPSSSRTTMIMRRGRQHLSDGGPAAYPRDEPQRRP